MTTSRTTAPKLVADVETEKISLEVYECACGFHLGIDSTFLEQVGTVRIACPSCHADLVITGDDDNG